LRCSFILARNNIDMARSRGGRIGVSIMLLASVLLNGSPSVSAQGGGGGSGGGQQVESATECDGMNSADYSESLSGTGTTMERQVGSTTGCPNHVHYSINPNSAKESVSDQSIPAYPMLIDSSGGSTDLSEQGNQVAIMLNGVSVFSGYADGVAATTYETSATYLEGSSFDLCGGHSTFDGTYHYHNTPGCLQEQAMSLAGTTTSDHTPQLGWSYDGFPIYGQLGPDGVEMLLCGSDEAHDTYCLDSCGGYEGELPDVDGFTYRYYNTCGFDEAFFPFTTNCYRGCCPTGVTCHEYVDACGSSATAGYTDDYTAAVVDHSLDEPYDTDLIAGDDNDAEDTLSSMDCSYYVGSAGAGTAPDDDEDGSNGATTSGGGPQPLLFLATSLMISGIASMRAFACIF
ncbi:unnamed protein product, partial [Ectocarpus fasciculatus]